MSLFCKHDWKVLTDKVTSSTFEMTLNAAKSNGAGDCKIPHQLCKDNRKHIFIASCAKCGKLHKTVTNLSD